MILLDDIMKEKIIEVINKYPGAFKDYKQEITNLEHNQISNQLLITVLENIIYDCQNMRKVIKSHNIYDSTFNNLDNLYNSIPKHPDFVENSGILYRNTPAFQNMNNETLLHTLATAFNVEQGFTNILKKQSFTNRAERILESIKSINDINLKLSETNLLKLQKIYTDIQNELNVNVDDITLNKLNDCINSYNEIATEVWNKYLENMPNKFLVHNYSRGNVENFTPSRFLSTSLFTDQYMSLFQENYNNNYGFIIKPKKIISAYYKDTFTHNRSEYDGIEMYSSKDIPPLLFPWEIEKECIKDGIEFNGEILNYDNGRSLPEIVLEDYEIIGVYHRTNGEGELSPSYEAASQLAKEYNLELKEFDISQARINVGLDPMTPKMKNTFFLNILRKMYMTEPEIKTLFHSCYNIQQEEFNIISKYEPLLYQAYLQLKENNNLNKEALISTMEFLIPNNELSTIKIFYDTYKQDKNYMFDENAANYISDPQSYKTK